MKKIINAPGTILKELRKSLAMPEDVAAKKLKIDLETLRKWESDGVTISVSKARKITNVYKKNWTILLLDKIPVKKDLSKEYRKLLKSIDFYSTETILAFRNAERILHLAELIKGRTTNKKEIESINVRLSSNIAKLVNDIRKWLNVSLQDQKSYKSEYEALSKWIQKIEDKGIYVSGVKMPIEEARAFILSDSKRSVIVLNKSDSVKGRIFSLFHEFAHILLEKKSTFDVYEEIEPGDKIEIFCNKLAGHLLVPDRVISKYWAGYESVEDIMNLIGREYKVSSYVVLRRLYDMRYIKKPLYDKLSNELKESYRKHREKTKTRKFYPPKLFYQKSMIKKNSFALTGDIFEAFRSKRITYYEVSSLLNVKLKHIPTIEKIVTNV